MKTKFRSILTLFLALLVQISFAQEKTVSGTVSEEAGPLPGVNVLVKGTSSGTQTDFDGRYSIKVNSGDVLVFSYVGMSNVEKTVGTSNIINVIMTGNNLLEEVIVTAYGTSTKAAFTGAADVVGAKDLALRSVTSPIAAIEGKATGVQFTSASGQPGSSPGMIIRGVGTLNGSAAPLYIVDGMQYEGGMSEINQDDIESFTILKDASSTSLYGSRAANGVVLITTKSGSKGDIKATASVQYGMISRAISDYDAVNPGEYYETMWEALRNTSAAGGDPAYASANIYNRLGYNPFNVPNDQIVGTDGKLNPSANLIYQGLDWYDAMEQTGIRKNYSINVAGGGDKHKVFFSASYLDEEGYVLTTGFDRLTTRLNADFELNNTITMGGSANIALSNSSGPTSAGEGSIANPFGFAKGMGSIYPVYVNDLQGNFVLDAGGNRIFDSGEGYSEYNIGSRPTNQGRHALQELLLNDERKKNNNYGFRYYADFNIMEGLNFRLNYGRDINEGLVKEYENNIIGDADPTGRYGEDRYRRDVENFNQILTYRKSINDIHNIEVTAGHESFKRLYSGFGGSAIKQVAEGIFEFDNFAEPVGLDGATTEKTVEGYFLRANYNFDNKYYISASARRDASSVFDEKSRWGNFYSVGASWRMDQEDFIRNISFIDQLKLRGSFGQVGNDDLGDFFLSQPRYGLTSNAGNPAIYWSEIGNADLQWETVESFDVALEFGLFNNLLDGSIEYYKKNSTDLLYDLPIALSNGLNEVPSNIADMYNSGIELSLTGHIVNKNDLKWNLTLQASTFKNEITNIPDPFINGSKRWEEGRSRYDFYILHTAGIDPDNGDQLFKMFEIDDDGNSVPVLDVNGVQETTNDWEETERAYTGDSAIPDILGSVSNSLSYKGFSLDVLMTYGFGGKYLDYGYAAMMHSGNYGRSYHPDILNAWRQPGDVTDVPRLESGSDALVQSASTRFLTDASFWTLKNINLGYSFDGSITDKIGVDNLRLSISGENLYLKSKRTGLDPQYSVGGTASGDDFSPARIFSVGLNVSF
ncbi:MULTISPECIES: SusC/RagA family TonB-linked outer membrane protein [Flavobacteriaceae]|uniref:SusC/RagA family TonB-linked outer membrane protein n=2 Tax=Flavobacteriaceae TaxID=49546 RepID=A0A4Y8AWQ2_9FLAO|nr:MULTISPECIES: SusC/RagA family TonB-linked outer membrane protein [Flavobacteriaceae]TEW76903.1 SusC/RagA family TonB-linked outer membrane protein [Gramella jeungdoensis]GGK59444.1 SusC/RagA family TonB-linked outer membrane protein [Lutibacter litoralis]